MGDPKVPTGPGWWWRFGAPVRVYEDGNALCFGVALGATPVAYSDPTPWGGRCLKPTEAAALTARAERAERERDELRAESAAYRAERDQMRRWAEAAAADENANAAELREVRRWFADARAAVNAGGAIDLDALGAILGGSRE